MELRSALAGHGITLPSLGRDFGTPALVILGNCNTATARALTRALVTRRGRRAGRSGPTRPPGVSTA